MYVVFLFEVGIGRGGDGNILERNMSSPPLRKQRNKRGESGGGVL
jgi:hypothetical protein